MRNIVIAGNWKMNKTKEEGLAFVEELKNKDLAGYSASKMIFAPSFMLDALVQATEGTEIIVGAQNMHQNESGAFTGEISADMLKSIGVETILIGHSERRQYFNETDAIVNEKLHLAINKGLKPVVCIGETLEEREGEITNQVLKTQTEGAFVNVDAKDAANTIIAYEPVWAIGTGMTATAEDANAACAYVREVVAGLYSQEVADQVIIQYGGSVNPANVEEILGQSDIDGALVGGASLEVDSYVSLLK